MTISNSNEGFMFFFGKLKMIFTSR